MKLDITSLYFNGDTESAGNTASWGTALGQERPNYPVSVEGGQDIVDLIKKNHFDFNPTDNSNHTANIKNLNNKIIFASGKFDSVFVNNIEFDGPFYLLVLEETSGSHIGRKILKYNNKIKVHDNSNEEFYNRISDYFGKEACWFIYEIFVKNGQLHMSAKKVANASKSYKNAKTRKKHWELLMDEYSSIKEEFKKYCLEIRNIKNESTVNEYINRMPEVKSWFLKHNICEEDFQIWDINNDISNIKAILKGELEDSWKKAAEKNEDGDYGFKMAVWNRWIEFIDWKNDLEVDGKDFENRIKSNTARSNGFFFNVLDRLINDLEIQNSEKIVFSTGSNQMSFQIGKRYCLSLKKDDFGFINPINSEFKGLKKQSFGKPDTAAFFEKSTSDIFIKNYESIKESIASELERDNNTEEKEYDNKVFRKAVFDKNYRNKFNNIETEVNSSKVKQVDFLIGQVIKDYQNSGIRYSDQLITRYISSLTTKPFVLLSGLSGSGKTKLAQSFSQWICEDENQYCIVPVGADWTNREPLLGYVNALDSTEYILPENGALQLLIEANKVENINKPYFLILDEMNLSHVERYFADFLSVMESKDKFKLHSDKEKEKSSVPHELSWPKNLFVVGTVNIDETTYMFSPKVLDRANVIEFRVNETEIENFLSTRKEITSITKMGASMGNSFVAIAEKKLDSGDNKELNTELLEFFKELQVLGAEFGYRTAKEIQNLFSKIDMVNPAYSNKVNEKIDIAIMQKLLPKLHGSRRKLLKTLNLLAQKCLAERQEVIFNERGIYNIAESNSIKYTLSFEKIARMYKNAIENGFASYAEA